MISTIDYEQFIVRDNLYTIISNDPNYPEEYLLALLNSNLINWYYQNIINNEVGEALAQVKKGHLSLLPIAPSMKSEKMQIIQLVEQILNAKISDPKADTSALENQIDQMVYKLYKLTYEEVKVIAPEFSLSPEEYEAVSVE